MKSSVGVVIPAYRPDLDALERYLDALQTVVDPEVIRVELDDPTPDTVTALSDAPAEVHAVGERRGKGAAITAGFERLDTDVFAFADADGSTPAESIDDVIAPVRTGEADLAVGSRRHPDADVQSHQSFFRRRLGDAFAWLARRALDVSLYDYQCGAKALTAETWRSIRTHLYEPGFAWDLELVSMAHATGNRIQEVPVTWIDHPESTVSAGSAVVEMFGGLLAARHRARLVAEDPFYEALDSYRDRTAPLVSRTDGK
ncbi:MAG: glycosyltransferase [Halobacteriota archaeon]